LQTNSIKNRHRKNPVFTHHGYVDKSLGISVNEVLIYRGTRLVGERHPCGGSGGDIGIASIAGSVLRRSRLTLSG